MEDLNPNSTGLILDLRDRMARIETKLDGHNAAHEYIDRRFDGLDATLTAQDLKIDANAAEIAASKTRVKVFAGIGTVALAIIPFLADHFSILRP